MSKWQPVVGGRAMLREDRRVVVIAADDDAATVVSTKSGFRARVPLSDLTEHPDDARHRRLLEAAREVGRAMDAMHAVGGSLSCCTSAEGIEEGLWRAIQELAAATAEADHA